MENKYFYAIIIYLSYNYIENTLQEKQAEKEDKVKHGELDEIAKRISGIKRSIFTESNERSQGRYERTNAADVYTEQKMGIIFRKV